jgi:hypothetical protein
MRALGRVGLFALILAVVIALDLTTRTRVQADQAQHPAIVDTKGQPCWSCHPDGVPGGCAHCHWPGPTPKP